METGIYCLQNLVSVERGDGDASFQPAQILEFAAVASDSGKQVTITTNWASEHHLFNALILS